MHRPRRDGSTKTSMALPAEGLEGGGSSPNRGDCSNVAATGCPEQQTPPSDNPLQPLLEQAVRESLRELARSAAESSANSGSSKSIDCIVRDVAARVIEEAGGTSVIQSAQNAAERCPPTPTRPLLQDLEATPWYIWQEQSSAPSSHVFGRRGSWDVPRVTCEPGAPLVVENCSESSESSDMLPAGSAGSSNKGGDDESVPEDASQVKDLGAQRRPSAQTTSPAKKAQLVGGSPSNASEAPLKITEGLTVESNSAQHLVMQWKGRPGAVLLICKPGDPLITVTLQDMAAWLSSQNVVTVLEQQLLADQPCLKNILTNVRTFTRLDELEKHIDLIITIGGDGTLTWAVSRFNGAMPPVLSFAAGSLGFLTPFPLDGWIRTLTRVFSSQSMPVPLVCRMRLRVTVQRRQRNSSSNDLVQMEQASNGSANGETMELHALNEVLVHRGRSGALAKLDVGVDGERVTVVQGDGIILATPTGSTAYSLAAGGSMAHPGVPAILMTPVSPHSLSFRPAVLPDSAVVCISVPLTARSGAALSVDGKDLCFLKLGDSVEVSCSNHPVPTICRTTGTADWFNSVQSALQWNGRVEQK